MCRGVKVTAAGAPRGAAAGARARTVRHAPATWPHRIPRTCAADGPITDHYTYPRAARWRENRQFTRFFIKIAANLPKCLSDDYFLWILKENLLENLVVS